MHRYLKVDPFAPHIEDGPGDSVGVTVLDLWFETKDIDDAERLKEQLESLIALLRERASEEASAWVRLRSFAAGSSSTTTPVLEWGERVVVQGPDGQSGEDLARCQQPLDEVMDAMLGMGW